MATTAVGPPGKRAARIPARFENMASLLKLASFAAAELCDTQNELTP